MKRTAGHPEVVIGLIDGPVALEHPGFEGLRVRGQTEQCSSNNATACMHGTFVAGILSARRGSPAPAICPECTLLVRPIFAGAGQVPGAAPSATADELAVAIVECVGEGAALLNLSCALIQAPSAQSERALSQALDYAAKHGVLVVAAAGNQGTVGSSAITRHPWVIAVAASDSQGRPGPVSNFGRSIGLYGLSAPGDAITSLSVDGTSTVSGGTSVAAPFVTGAIALVWSLFRQARAAELRMAVVRAHARRRPTLIPPMLNAMAIYNSMATRH